MDKQVIQSWVDDLIQAVRDNDKAHKELNEAEQRERDKSPWETEPWVFSSLEHYEKVKPYKNEVERTKKEIIKILEHMYFDGRFPEEEHILLVSSKGEAVEAYVHAHAGRNNDEFYGTADIVGKKRKPKPPKMSVPIKTQPRLRNPPF